MPSKITPNLGPELLGHDEKFQQPVRSLFFEGRNGEMLHMRRAGHGGFKCLFVHGWGSDSRLWLPLMTQISSGISSYALDLPGHGLSSPQTSPLEWASVVSEIASKLSGPVVLVGHSMGARIAALAAGMSRPKIAGIVSVDGDLGAYAYTPKQRWRFLRHFITEKGNGVALTYLSQLCSKDSDLGHWGLIREMAQGVPLETKRLSLNWIVSSRAEAAVSCPVYGIFSNRTTSTHRIAELRRVAPQARLEIIENSDHFLPLSATGLLAHKLTNFLRSDFILSADQHGTQSPNIS
jgi:pimeloyl-ACP methyl ester carboxylesterase